jgi:putative spermidine/putrescine transport system permease protein
MKRLIPLLTLFIVLFVLPLAVLVLYTASSSWSWPEIVPGTFDLRSLRYLQIHSRDIALNLASSCLYSLGTVLLTLAMTITPAKLFARREFKGKYLLEGLFLAPALIPPMAFAMGAHYLFIYLGLADTFAGVILILGLFSYPYMLRALTGGYHTFDDRLTLCARNMGASPARILLTIELPMLVPAMIAGGSIVFLVAFSEYFLVFLIGGGIVPSYAGYIFPLLNSSDKSIASMLTLLFLVVPILLFILLDRIVYGGYRKRGIA